MKIGWFTPFAAGAPLAGFGAAVAGALAELGHEAVVMRLDDDGRPAHAFAGVVAPWRFWPVCAGFDVNVFNVGDDFTAFAPVFDIARRLPGIVIVHADTLSGYFDGLAAASGDAPPRLDATASLERIAREASGGIAATAALASALAAACAGPVIQMEPPRNALAATAYARRFLALADAATAADPLLQTARQFGDRLADLGARRGDPAAARIAAAARDLFPSTLRASAQADPA